MEANKVLAGATKIEKDLALAEGYLWVVAKSANGSQRIIEVVGAVPEELLGKVPTGCVLKELYTTYLPRFHELTGLPGWVKLPERERKRYLWSIRDSEDGYKETLEDAAREIGSLEPEVAEVDQLDRVAEIPMTLTRQQLAERVKAATLMSVREKKLPRMGLAGCPRMRVGLQRKPS